MYNPFTSLPIYWTFSDHVNANYQGGIDYTASSTSTATQVRACGSGTIVVADGFSSSATSSEVRIDHGGGVTSSYMHLKTKNYSVGDPISEGAIIGLSGGAAGDIGRGVANGPHIHWHITVDGERVDPAAYVAGLGSGVLNDLSEEEDMHIVYVVQTGHSDATDPFYMLLPDGTYRVITRTEFYLRRKNPYDPDSTVKKKVNELALADLTALLSHFTLIPDPA